MKDIITGLLQLNIWGMLNIGNYIGARLLEIICQDSVKANMVQSSIHSMIVVLGSYLYFITENNLLYQSLKLYSMSHLLVDMVYFHLYKNVNQQKNIYTFHHSVFIMAWVLAEYYSVEIYLRFLLAEITVLPMNLKFYYKNKDANKEIFYGTMTYVLFLIFRVINFTIQFREVIGLEYYGVVPLLLPLTMLQYYWFYLMTLKVKKIVLKAQ